MTTLAEAKEALSSDKFMLVRFTPGRYINDDLSNTSGSLYEATLSDFTNVSKLTRNGTELTEVTTITGNDEYTFNESTKVLTVQLASAPNVDTNVLIVYHHLFVTATKTRFLAEDPTQAVTSSNPIREWEPRLSVNPTITESFTNILNGFFTVQGSQLDLINTEQYLNRFLTINDSFRNKDIKIWQGIDEATPELIYSGFTDNVSITDADVSITLLDQLQAIDQTASFGDTLSQRVFGDNSLQTVTADPSQINQPIPMVLGNGTPYRFHEYSFANASVSTSVMDPEVKAFDVSYANRGLGSNYVSDGSSGNDSFVLFRLHKDLAIETQTIGTFVRSTTQNYGAITKVVHHYYFTGHNLKVGQTFKWDDGSGPYYSFVMHVGDYSYSGSDYNVMVAEVGTNSLTDPVMSAGSEFRPLAFPILMIYRGTRPTSQIDGWTPILAKAEEDFNLSTATTAGGHTQYRIVEAFAGAFSFDPSEGDRMHWQVSVSGEVSHAETMELLLKEAGLSVDAATFAQADLDLVADCRFQVPIFGERQEQSYRYYCERIAFSTLGYLRPGRDGEIEYELLSSPAAGDLRDDRLIVRRSAGVEHDYGDTVSELKYANPSQALNAEIGEEPTQSVVSNKSRYLNDQVKVEELSHVLDDISGRIDDHLKVRALRQAKYTYSTASEDVDTELGDNITIENDKITTDGSVNVRVTSTSRQDNRTRIGAQDLGEL